MLICIREPPPLLTARRTFGIALLLAVAGCTPSPLEWSDSVTRIPLPSPDARLVVDARGDVATSDGERVADPVGACAGSVRVVARGSLRFMAWWSAEPNAGARLQFARSSDAGATWSEPIVVDARDAGSRACARPPLSLSSGTGSEYLHIVYWIEPANGAAVFFTHSMDGGAMFHAPVAVVYGARPVRADVASLGDTVVVAHEDPNAPVPRLLLAISRTAGHIFEHRLSVPAEGDYQPAPRVALSGRDVFAAWVDPRGSALVVRRGRLGDS